MFHSGFSSWLTASVKPSTAHLEAQYIENKGTLRFTSQSSNRNTKGYLCRLTPFGLQWMWLAGSILRSVSVISSPPSLFSSQQVAQRNSRPFASWSGHLPVLRMAHWVHILRYLPQHPRDQIFQWWLWMPSQCLRLEEHRAWGLRNSLEKFSRKKEFQAFLQLPKPSTRLISVQTMSMKHSYNGNITRVHHLLDKIGTKACRTPSDEEDARHCKTFSTSNY